MIDQEGIAVSAFVHDSVGSYVIATVYDNRANPYMTCFPTMGTNLTYGNGFMQGYPVEGYV
jgi:hypothetical protein